MVQTRLNKKTVSADQRVYQDGLLKMDKGQHYQIGPPGFNYVNNLKMKTWITYSIIAFLIRSPDFQLNYANDWLKL